MGCMRAEGAVEGVEPQEEGAGNAEVAAVVAAVAATAVDHRSHSLRTARTVQAGVVVPLPFDLAAAQATEERSLVLLHVVLEQQQQPNMQNNPVELVEEEVDQAEAVVAACMQMSAAPRTDFLYS